MRVFTRIRLSLGVGVGLIASTSSLRINHRGGLLPHAPAHAESSRAASSKASAEDDPHRWLEEIEGDAALAWCREQNARTEAALGDPKQSDAYRKILAIADSKEKIPHVGRIGGTTGDAAAKVLYNFWQVRATLTAQLSRNFPQFSDAPHPSTQDAEHVRGLWRRCSLASYKSASPEWEDVLDLDALNAKEKIPEGAQYVWHGYDVLDEGPGKAAWDRALVFLSPGGTDAQLVREFDLTTRSFVDGGFATADAAKCDVGFRTRDEVLIGTDFGPGSLTDSGYPRVVRSWKRGTPLESAKVVFEVEAGDISGSMYTYHDRGHVHEFQLRQKTFYSSEQWYRSPDLSLAAADDPTPFVKLDLPEDTNLSTFGDRGVLLLRSDWSPPGAGRSFAAGSLLAAPLADVLDGDWGKVTALFEPPQDNSASLQDYSATHNFLVLKTSEHVRTKLQFYKIDDASGGWALAGGAAAAGGGDGLVPAGEDVHVSAVWPDDSDEVWLTTSGFLQPSSLSIASAADGCAKAEPLKALPAQFDAATLECTQHFAPSKDGTKVPYFLLGPKGTAAGANGPIPTLLDGYGGFEISMEPYYSGSVGAAWLSRGAAKAIANIRGGGEYGPQWHQAALREKRHKAYEDFEAVAQDLVGRGVTTPKQLGAIGGSNGGLLMGNMLTREGRKLFGAIVCQVPLLDMKVYHTLLAGASWMEEYGDPEADGVWEKYLKSISPYHRLRGDACADGSGWEGAPRTLFTTSTKDDRVHPGHARKMVKAMVDEVPPEKGGGNDNVFYFENIEGGHGGAADNKQRAYMWALSYDFLWETLRR